MRQPLCESFCLGLGEAGPHSQHELHPPAASPGIHVLVLRAQNVLLFLDPPIACCPCAAKSCGTPWGSQRASSCLVETAVSPLMETLEPSKELARAEEVLSWHLWKLLWTTFQIRSKNLIRNSLLSHCGSIWKPREHKGKTAFIVQGFIVTLEAHCLWLSCYDVHLALLGDI